MNAIGIRCLLFTLVSQPSLLCAAEIIDPEVIISTRGHHSKRLGDDGKTPFFTYTERASATRVSAIEKDIAALPKHSDVLRVCELTRGAVKAKLIEQRGQPIDVAVFNYGYRGAVIACTLKYMLDAKVGTQHFFMKKGVGGMYSVYITD